MRGRPTHRPPSGRCLTHDSQSFAKRKHAIVSDLSRNIAFDQFLSERISILSSTCHDEPVQFFLVDQSTLSQPVNERFKIPWLWSRLELRITWWDKLRVGRIQRCSDVQSFGDQASELWFIITFRNVGSASNGSDQAIDFAGHFVRTLLTLIADGQMLGDFFGSGFFQGSGNIAIQDDDIGAGESHRDAPRSDDGDCSSFGMVLITCERNAITLTSRQFVLDRKCLQPGGPAPVTRSAFSHATAENFPLADDSTERISLDNSVCRVFQEFP